MPISATLIAKNERGNVEPCLTSFADHVDEIVFVDTGSRDGTVGEVRRVCREHGWTDKLVLGRFRWVDDFAAARNHAASLATGDVHMWVDLDDRVFGAENLAEIVETFERSPNVGVISSLYVYERDPKTLEPKGMIGSEARRLLFRAPVPWSHPTYEYVPLREGEEEIPSNLVWRLHRKTRANGQRDLRIARAWSRREPDNEHALIAIMNEGLALGLHREAAAAGERALRLVAKRDRGTILNVLAKIAYRDGRPKDAQTLARGAIQMQTDPDYALLLRGRWAFLFEDWPDVLEALHSWVFGPALAGRQGSLEAGVLLAYAAAMLARWDLACDAAEATLPLWVYREPEGEELFGHYQAWRERRLEQRLNRAAACGGSGQRLAATSATRRRRR